MAILFAALLALAQDELPVTVSWKDGLKFKAADGAFEFSIGGRILAHYRLVDDRPDEPAAATNGNLRSYPDTLYLRQARIDLNGTLFKEFDFRLYLDFPTGTYSTTGAAANPSAVSGTLQDAYVGWRRIPEFSLRIGQFKEPISQEQTTTLRATDFVERSVLDRLIPGRDLGIGAFGKVGGGVFEYEAGVFGGSGRSVVDANDEKDVAGRIRFSPFKNAEEGFLFKGLRFGVAGTYGDVDNASIDGLDLFTTELQIRFFNAGSAATIDGVRSRVAAEFTWLWESFGLRAEVVRRTDHVDTATRDGAAVAANAGYVTATWLLTGEKKALEDRNVPTHPFFEEGGWGAFELVFRVAQLKIDEEVYNLGLASPATDPNRVTTFTAGLNWYLTRNLRISPNFVLEKFNDDIVFANGDRRDSFKGVLVRFQVDF